MLNYDHIWYTGNCKHKFQSGKGVHNVATILRGWLSKKDTKQALVRNFPIHAVPYQIRYKTDADIDLIDDIEGRIVDIFANQEDFYIFKYYS